MAPATDISNTPLLLDWIAVRLCVLGVSTKLLLLLVVLRFVSIWKSFGIDGRPRSWPFRADSRPGTGVCRGSRGPAELCKSIFVYGRPHVNRAKVGGEGIKAFGARHGAHDTNFMARMVAEMTQQKRHDTNRN